MPGTPCSILTSKLIRSLLALRTYHASKSHMSSTAESTTRNALPCPLPPQVEPLVWVRMRPGALVVAATTVLRTVILVTSVEAHLATREFLPQHEPTIRALLHTTRLR